MPTRSWPNRSGAATAWGFHRTPTTGHTRTSWKSGCGWRAAKSRRPPPWPPSFDSKASSRGSTCGDWSAATEHATVKALAALGAGADAATLTARAEKVARLVDGSRLLHLNSYLTFHDAVIGRLLIAAGQPEKARERLEMALRHAENTGMRFHDAELMRLRAHTFTEPNHAARPWPPRLSSHATKARHCSNCVVCWIFSTCSATGIGPSWPALSAASPVTLVGRNLHGHKRFSRDPP